MKSILLGSLVFFGTVAPVKPNNGDKPALTDSSHKMNGMDSALCNLVHRRFQDISNREGLANDFYTSDEILEVDQQCDTLYEIFRGIAPCESLLLGVYYRDEFIHFHAQNYSSGIIQRWEYFFNKDTLHRVAMFKDTVSENKSEGNFLLNRNLIRASKSKFKSTPMIRPAGKEIVQHEAGGEGHSSAVYSDGELVKIQIKRQVVTSGESEKSEAIRPFVQSKFQGTGQLIQEA